MKESLVQFFAEYKAARCASDREKRRIDAELEGSFYTSERACEKVEKWLHAREKEEITDALEHGQRAEMVTTGDLAGPKRYLVIRSKEEWRIEKVQLRCTMCKGTGRNPLLKVSKGDCEHCSGLGWVEWGD